MIRKSSGHLVYYTFEIFAGYPLKQGIFTRLGGVSNEQWTSLNLSTSSGDSSENVIENRNRVLDALALDRNAVFDVWLEHGSKYRVGTRPRKIGTPHEKADIILTKTAGLALLMLFADCVPIFLFDPINRAIAIAHAGWRGTIHKVADTAVRAMMVEFGSNPRDILAGIGPSIGPDHYVVSSDILEQSKARFGQEAKVHFLRKGGELFLNLWSMNEMILRSTGIEKIEQSHLCTACSPGEWFSHRAEAGKTGRFPAVFCLDKGLLE